MGMCYAYSPLSATNTYFEAFDWLMGHLEALLSADKAD